jgi:hypothetical protein
MSLTQEEAKVLKPALPVLVKRIKNEYGLNQRGGFCTMKIINTEDASIIQMQVILGIKTKERFSETKERWFILRDKLSNKPDVNSVVNWFEMGGVL